MCRNTQTIPLLLLAAGGALILSAFFPHYLARLLLGLTLVGLGCCAMKLRW